MSNDERVAKLNEQLDVALTYSDKIDNQKVAKPDLAKLKKLAQQIRERLEDDSIEAATHTHASI